MDYDPLKPDQIRLLIRILEAALAAGTRVQASPLLPLLELLIDYSLQMASSLGEERIELTRKLNPRLQEDRNQVDSLGNSLMMKIHIPRPTVHMDRKFEYAFQHLSEDLVHFRNYLFGVEQEYREPVAFFSFVAELRRQDKDKKLYDSSKIWKGHGEKQQKNRRGYRQRKKKRGSGQK